ncbi:hypothetical protein, partial [Rhizobium sp.]|uniref:hypothetical protein n=1 Tax=Rhizobium sp. TaxID=391 RepID=UPI00389B3922
HLLFKGWLKQPNPSNQKRIMQIPHSKCRESGFVQSLFRFRLKQSRSRMGEPSGHGKGRQNDRGIGEGLGRARLKHVAQKCAAVLRSRHAEIKDMKCGQRI